MKILVTGGAGFIGSHVVKHLVAAGKDVRVFHLPNEKLDNLKGCDVELVAGNVLDKASVDKAVKGCAQVYHLAAVYAFWMKDPQMMFDVNVRGTSNIFDACLEHGVEKVVYTSSIARYGGQGNGKIADENSPFGLMRTGELYSISKFMSHEVAEDYANNKGLNVTIVCPGLPMGPGDIGPTPTGKYIIGIIKNPIAYYVDVYTNIADVRDIAYGHLLAMEKGQKGRSYILGGMTDITMKEIVEICLKLSGQEWKPLLKIPPKIFETIAYFMEMYADFVSQEAPMMTSRAAKANTLGLRADCSRAILELGYTSRPFEESLRDAIDWFKEHGYL